MVEIKVLAVGYSRTLSDQSMEANCSCVLIKDNGINVIVDTMTAWDGELIKEALSEENIVPEEIHFVINTHGHSDHTGCNHLFLKATHIMGSSSSTGDLYKFHDLSSGDYRITDNIRIVSTPGHTSECVSVIAKDCQGLGVVAISGDLFEREDDIKDDSIWQSAGSFDKTKQIISRHEVSLYADYIIPGHGPMFRLTEEYREILKQRVTFVTL